MERPVLYYVRHGETSWNVAGRLQGRRDVALNARGRQQAIRCGEILQRLLAAGGRAPADLDYIASPLVRAQETMKLMREALGIAPACHAVDARLAELSFGDWEGLTLAEIAARDPAAIATRERNKWGFVPPNGESYQQMTVRMGEWYSSLRRDSIVVAHGGTARALLVLLGIAPSEAAPHVAIDQGVVYVLAKGSMERERSLPLPVSAPA